MCIKQNNIRYNIIIKFPTIAKEYAVNCGVHWFRCQCVNLIYIGNVKTLQTSSFCWELQKYSRSKQRFERMRDAYQAPLGRPGRRIFCGMFDMSNHLYGLIVRQSTSPRFYTCCSAGGCSRTELDFGCNYIGKQINQPVKSKVPVTILNADIDDHILGMYYFWWQKEIVHLIVM